MSPYRPIANRKTWGVLIDVRTGVRMGLRTGVRTGVRMGVHMGVCMGVHMGVLMLFLGGVDFHMSCDVLSDVMTKLALGTLKLFG